MDSDREEPRKPKVPFTLSITNVTQKYFLSIKFTKVDTQFVFLEQSFIAFFNKISNISCDDVLNVNSIVGLRTLHLHKRDFSRLDGSREFVYDPKIDVTLTQSMHHVYQQ